MGFHENLLQTFANFKTVYIDPIIDDNSTTNNNTWSADKISTLVEDASSRNIKQQTLNNNSALLGMNSLTIPYNSAFGSVSNGITYTAYSKTKILASGTVSPARSSFNILSLFSFDRPYPGGRYHFSGCPEGGSDSTYSISILIRESSGDDWITLKDYGSGCDFTLPDNAVNFKIIIYIEVGVTVDGLIFSPELIKLDSISVSKQDKLTTGDGIDISNDEISAKVDGTTITFNSNGEMVASSSASSLDTLTDVNITSLSNDQILQYDSTSGKWVNTNNTGGATIDDTTTSANSVWSSSKVNTEINSKSEIDDTTTSSSKVWSSSKVSSEIGAKTEINDSATTTTNTWSANKINSLISGLMGIDFEIVQTLPTQDISTHTIYLLPKSTSKTNNVYDEYIYVNNAWELIGDTTVDLSNYYTKTETNTLLNGKQATLTAGDNITIENNVISATGGGTIKWQEIYPN